MQVTKGGDELYDVSVSVTFNAGHRLLNYEGKCASPHGHTYRAELSIESSELDEVTMVADFSDLKRRAKTWIDRHWDHGFLLNSLDTDLIEALSRVRHTKIYTFDRMNPTAEAMARVLHRQLCNESGGWVTAVTIWESPDQRARYSGSAL